MEHTDNKRLLLNPFALSICLHALLLILFIFFMIQQPKAQKRFITPPVPAYIYSNKVPPRVERRSHAQSVRTKSVISNSLFAPSMQQADLNSAKTKNLSPRKSIFASSLEMLHQTQMEEMSAAVQDDEPLLLIGEESAFSDPFLLLLGKAISANFFYPKTAGQLGIKGQVIVSLILHPEGNFTNVYVIKSSNNHDLDAAALFAVNQAPIIKHMKRFISQPKHFNVGFIFR